MARRCIGYAGDGKHRKPVWRDEGPASGSGQGGAIEAHAEVARLSTVVLSQLQAVGANAPVGGAGRVERSQATAAQREAWRADRPAASPIARVTVDRPALNSREHLQASRMRGAQRHVEVLADRHVHPPDPPPEEPVMAEAAPPTVTDVVDPDPLALLSGRAAEAREAWRAHLDAEGRWTSARDALEEAWLALWQPGAPLSVDEVEPEPPDRLPAQEIELGDGTRMRAHSDGKPETLEALRELGEVAVAKIRAEQDDVNEPATETPAARMASIASERATAAAGGPGIPPYQRRMLDALVAANGDVPTAAAAIGIKATSLTGTMGRLRKLSGLTDAEQAVVARKR